jgi:hypothetical protein
MGFPPVATWGRVTKVTPGWPPKIPTRKRKGVDYTEKFVSILGWFNNVTDNITNNITGLHPEHLFEYDDALFLRKINAFELERVYEDGTTRKYEMSTKELHKVITHFESTGEGWW